MKRIAFRVAPLACFVLATVSCWMPSFDPALSMSTEMDAFFVDAGMPEWRVSYSFTVKDDRWRDGAEFLPLRRDPLLNPPGGGFLVRRDASGIGLAQIVASAGIVEVPWTWERDFNPLGRRALVEPFLDMPNDILIFRDPYKGLESLSTASSEPCVCGSPLVYEGKSLAAFGTETLNEAGSENQIRVSVVVKKDSDGLADAGYGQANIGTYTPGWNYGATYLTGATEPPGWAAYDDDVLAIEPWAVTLDGEDPGLWRFGPAVYPDPTGNARRIGDVESLGTATVHSGSTRLILAEGPFVTDIYDFSGAHLGWLPTGSWRFAFEWWDSAGLRWISVFTRFAVLTDNHDEEENLAFAQVEGVPTASLLAEASKNK